MPAITFLPSPDDDETDGGRQVTIEVFYDGSVTVAIVDIANGGRIVRRIASATVKNTELARAVGAIIPSPESVLQRSTDAVAS